VLVIISFALVLVAVVLLVLGLLTGTGLGLIYVSMACSFLAGVVLYIAIRVSRPKAEAGADGPAPLDEPAASTTAPAAAPVAATSGGEERPSSGVAVLDRPTDGGTDLEESVEETVADDAVDSDEWMAGDELAELSEDDSDDEFFPIADYDDLKVSEIIPLLPELYSDELDVVEERERSGKARVSILGRIAELRETGTRADEELAAEEGGDDAPTAAVEPTLADAPLLEEEVAAEPAPEPDAGEWRADDVDAWEAPAAVSGLPIPGYDDLKVAEILPLLSDLGIDDLHEIRRHEEAGAGRKTILTAIERNLVDDTGEPTTTAATATRSTRKSAAKKSSAKKSSARKASTKKAAAKKSAAKKSAAKKAGGKKAAAKKSAKKARKSSR
jgi:hypothetical protein